MVLEVHSYIIQVETNSFMAFLLYHYFIFPTKCNGHEANLNVSFITAIEGERLLPSYKAQYFQETKVYTHEK